MLMLFVDLSESIVLTPDLLLAAIVAGDRAWSSPPELAELLGAPLVAVHAALVEAYADDLVDVWPIPGGPAFTLSAIAAEARGVEVREPAGDGTPRWAYVGATDDRSPLERKTFRSSDPRWLKALIARARPNRQPIPDRLPKSNAKADRDAAEERRARELRKARRRARLAG